MSLVTILLLSRRRDVRDFALRESLIGDQSAGPCALSVLPAFQQRERPLGVDIHKLNSCTDTLMTFRFGCIGVASSPSSSLAVGIHMHSRPFVTSVRDAKFRMSFCRASKP